MNEFKKQQKKLLGLEDSDEEDNDEEEVLLYNITYVFFNMNHGLMVSEPAILSILFTFHHLYLQVDQQIDEIFNSTGGIKETVSSGLIPILANQSNASESSQSQASKLAKAAESAAQILAKKNIGKVR